ncbi:hypothetical protein [Flavobacterium sp. 83]|uniref:hypothetical protein n=1 Tax=Flavobacterium sp. 83 TaxID=1131812 RepID=UPI0009DED1DA|nr:hypothetical protein [Flavobacterium sp. 83]
MLSSNAFFARILAKENAETFGSLDCGMSIFTVGVETEVALTVTFGSFSSTVVAIGVVSISIFAFRLFTSTIE